MWVHSKIQGVVVRLRMLKRNSLFYSFAVRPNLFLWAGQRQYISIEASRHAQNIAFRFHDVSFVSITISVIIFISWKIHCNLLQKSNSIGGATLRIFSCWSYWTVRTWEYKSISFFDHYWFFFFESVHVDTRSMIFSRVFWRLPEVDRQSSRSPSFDACATEMLRRIVALNWWSLILSFVVIGWSLISAPKRNYRSKEWSFKSPFIRSLRICQ